MPDFIGYSRDEMIAWIEYQADKIKRLEEENEFLRFRMDGLDK